MCWAVAGAAGCGGCPGYQPGRFPVMAGASLPFVFANAKSGSSAAGAWYRPYAAKEMKDVTYCFAFLHDPDTFHSRRKLLSPTDVKGLKVRPATSPIVSTPARCCSAR